MFSEKFRQIIHRNLRKRKYFKRVEANLRVINHNLKRLEELLEKEEAKEVKEEIDDPYYFSDGMHW